jgi:hypothetical protein
MTSQTGCSRRVTAGSVQLLALLLATVLQAGCHGGGGGGGGGGEKVTAVIGPAGGTVNGPDGVQVVVPAGALGQPTAIGIARSAAGAPALLPTQGPTGGGIYELTPHDLTFDAPVTIRMPVPPGSQATEIFMAELGGDWGVTAFTTSNGYAEWGRNTFSWFVNSACQIPVHNTDPYVCSSPSSVATASATPASALGPRVGTLAPLGWGSWTVLSPGTIRLTLEYAAAPDCSSPVVTLKRWNGALSPRVAANVTTLLNELPVTLTPTTTPPRAGSGLVITSGGPPTTWGVGSTTVDVSSHLGDAANHFALEFSCQRPGDAHPRSGRDEVVIHGPMAPPAVVYTLGGTITGLTGAGLVLHSGVDDLAVPVNAISFTFGTPLPTGATYGVSVLTPPAGQTCTVTNGTGQMANANVTNVQVACVDIPAKGWGTATRIEDGLRDANPPRVAMDGSGNAIAVWRQDYTDPATGFSGFVAMANRFVPGAGWGTAGIISDGYLDSGYPPLYARVAMNAAGTAVAVWEQFDPGTFGSSNVTSIWSNRYTPGLGWGAATLVEDRTTSAFAPQVAVDAAGNAVVVWLGGDSYSGRSIWGNSFVAGTGWGTSVQVIAGINTDAPQLAGDAAGNALVACTKGSGEIWANRLTAGSGWGTATSILATGGRDLRIAMNAGGTAYLVWDTYDTVTSTSSIWSKRYDGAGWQGAEQIDGGIDIGSGSGPQVAVDVAGDGFAVWSRLVGASYRISFARRPALGAWSPEGPLDDSTGTAGASMVAVNAGGDAFAVWYQYDGTRYNIWSNHRTAVAGAWGGAELIETDNAGTASDPQVVVDGSGNALAVWRQIGGAGTVFNIRSNRFQ